MECCDKRKRLEELSLTAAKAKLTLSAAGWLDWNELRVHRRRWGQLFRKIAAIRQAHDFAKLSA